MLNRATAAWTLRVIRTAAPRLLAVLVALTLLQGLLPAALAMALRGLINAAAAGAAADVSSQLLGWVALAFVLTAADALTGLAVGYAGQRLADDLNLHLTGEILAHAWSLDLSFFEDPERQDLLARTQANVGIQLQGLVLEALNVLRQLLTAVALLLVLAAVEPLVLLVVPPFSIPFLYFQWRLAKHRHAEQQQRATNLRWTSYFVSKLTAPESVAEVKLLDLGPLLDRTVPPAARRVPRSRSAAPPAQLSGHLARRAPRDRRALRALRPGGRPRGGRRGVARRSGHLRRCRHPAPVRAERCHPLPASGASSG